MNKEELVVASVVNDKICVKVKTDDGSYTVRYYALDKWTVASAIQNAIMDEAYQEAYLNSTPVQFYTDEMFDEFYEENKFDDFCK